MQDKFSHIRAREQKLLCATYSRYPLALVRGDMSRVWDSEGKEYIDLLAGIAVAALGHCNREICQTLAEQSHKLWHVSNLFYQEEQLELAERILDTSHFEKAFFCNSGAEANEAAIKIARRYMQVIRKRPAYEIISLSGCFHGRTLGTLAATGRDNLSLGFTPLPDGFRQVPVNDLGALKAAITQKTAAVIVEVVQGEGGVIPLDNDYLKGVQKLIRENDILFICDEVQAGFCRTGTFWAFQNAGLTPDICSTAKGLANGLPMGAMMTTGEVGRAFEPGSHATTFGGGALTSKVASKVVEIMVRDRLADRARDLGQKLTEKLEKCREAHPSAVTEIRSRGLMIGIDIVNCDRVWHKLLDLGYICGLSHGKTLRLLPALTIGEDELLGFADALNTALAE